MQFYQPVLILTYFNKIVIRTIHVNLYNTYIFNKNNILFQLNIIYDVSK